MKKQEIKKAVERAAVKHMGKAITDEGEYKARDEVRRAMQEEPAPSEGGVHKAEHGEKSGTKVIHPSQIESYLGGHK
jgi:hypothetical protein